MPRRTKEDAVKTRQAILNTALKMFYDCGYSKTSLSGIARKLGLSKGAVYWHFCCKFDLFRSISEKISGKLIEELTPVADKTESIDDLKYLFVRFAKYIDKDSETKKFLTILFFKIEWEDEMLDQIAFINDKRLKNFCELHISKWQKKEIIIDTIKAEDAARVLVSGFNGCIMTNILNPDFVSIVKTSVDIFFKGIENRKE